MPLPHGPCRACVLAGHLKKNAISSAPSFPKGYGPPLEKEVDQNGCLSADNKPTPTIKHAGIVKWWTLANFFVEVRSSV